MPKFESEQHAQPWETISLNQFCKLWCGWIHVYWPFRMIMKDDKPRLLPIALNRNIFLLQVALILWKQIEANTHLWKKAGPKATSHTIQSGKWTYWIRFYLRWVDWYDAELEPLEPSYPWFCHPKLSNDNDLWWQECGRMTGSHQTCCRGGWVEKTQPKRIGDTVRGPNNHWIHQ